MITLQQISTTLLLLTFSLAASAQESAPVDVSAPVGLAIIAALIVLLKPKNKK